MGAGDLTEERLALQPTDKPVGIFRAIGIARRTTWRSPLFYVLVVGAMQLALVLVAIPVIRLHGTGRAIRVSPDGRQM